MAENSSIKSPRSRLDIIGQKCHMLEVVAFAGLDSRRNSLWLCRCDCGTEKVIKGSRIRAKTVKSCGCVIRGRRQGSYTHWPEFLVWQRMLHRCSDPKNPSWQRYGGRGIAVCERWKEKFLDFFADMGSRPSPAHSLDRINNEGNYEPGNCRWALPKEQSRNTRTNRIVEAFGLRMTMVEWSEHVGMNRRTLQARLNRMSPEEALTAPVIKGERPECCRGHLLSGDNLYTSSKGRRRCRECSANWARKNRLNKMNQ